MTSKNLCFKLMKEDAKRRIWLIALLFLGLFFSIVIPVVYAGSAPDLYMQEGEWLRQVTSTVEEMLGHGNPFVVILLSFVAVISGVSGFSYLHSAKKVDLYHSIPVKREQLFLAHFLSGVLMVAVIYALNLLIGTVAAAVYGVEFGITAKLAFTGFCFHMAYYLLMYATVVLAMILTGNTIIALLGAGLFFSYGPIVSTLMMGYTQVYFHTYSGLSQYGGDAFFESAIMHSSPFFNYMNNMSNYSKINLVTTILLVVVVALVLALLAGWLYHIRPSESAGKAMAFTWVKLPLKILVVIPAALGFSMFFWAMRSTLGWSLFGLLWGVLFAHCLMEIIYHFDFRQLFTNKRHLLLCLTLSLAIFGIFKYDWFGYDSYLPKAENVKTAAVSLADRDHWVTYGDVRYETDHIGRRSYYWEYKDSAEYASEHMKLTDVEMVLSIAQNGIESNRPGDDAFDRDRDYHTVTIQYTLENGRKPVRRYQVYSDSVEEKLDQMKASPEYKMGTFPILNQTSEETARVNFQQFNQVKKVETGDKAELLLAYQEDLKQLTLETRRMENPIATIQFMTTDMDEAVRYEQEQGENDRNRYSISNIENRAYYPIYPSFTRTIACLNRAGVQVKGGLTAGIINQIRIVGVEDKEDNYTYPQSVDGSEGTIYTDVAQIEALVPALIPYDYWDMNRMMDEAILSGREAIVSVYSGTNGEVQEMTCYLNKTKVPDFVK